MFPERTAKKYQEVFERHIQMQKSTEALSSDDANNVMATSPLQTSKPAMHARACVAHTHTHHSF